MRKSHLEKIKLFLLFFILFLPTSSQSFLFSISEEKEIQLGKLYYHIALDDYGGRFPEEKVQAYLERLGQRISAQAERKVPYSFTLVNSGIENAFALPGGPVFITRGLFLLLDSESELVGVLAHEIGHINARHHVKFMEKNMTLGLLLQIGSLFLPQNLTGEVLYQLARLSAGLLSLKFSRDQEREADAFAFNFTLSTGYSPQGMAELFQKFKEKEKKSSGKPPEWLSTHPLPETRIKEWQEKLITLKPSGILIKDREEFHQIKEILIKTVDSFKLSEEGNKLLKENNLALAEEKLLKALEIYPKNIPALIGLAKIALKRKNFEEAKKYGERIKALDEKLFTAYLLLGITNYHLKNYEASLSALEKAKNLIPFSGYVYYWSGVVQEAMGRLNFALRNYKEALELGPKNEPWYEDCLRRYNRLIRRGYF